MRDDCTSVNVCACEYLCEYVYMCDNLCFYMYVCMSVNAHVRMSELCMHACIRVYR